MKYTRKHVNMNEPIDFEEASRAWRKNKKYLGNGTFQYRCAHYRPDTDSYCGNPPARLGLNKSSELSKIWEMNMRAMYCTYHAKRIGNKVES